MVGLVLNIQALQRVKIYFIIGVRVYYYYGVQTTLKTFRNTSKRF